MREGERWEWRKESTLTWIPGKAEEKDSLRVGSEGWVECEEEWSGKRNRIDRVRERHDIVGRSLSLTNDQ